MRRRHGILSILAIAAAAAVLAPVIVPFFAPWSGINRQDRDINIKTGQTRYSRRLWFVKISETIEDTPLSVALQGEVVDVAGVEPWHRTCTTSRPLVGHSPHYVFHGALHQAHLVGMVFDKMPESSKDTKKRIARKVLTLWQTTGDDGAANDYITGLLMEEAD